MTGMHILFFIYVTLSIVGFFGVLYVNRALHKLRLEREKQKRNFCKKMVEHYQHFAKEFQKIEDAAPVSEKKKIHVWVEYMINLENLWETRPEVMYSSRIPRPWKNIPPPPPKPPTSFEDITYRTLAKDLKELQKK